MKRVVRRALLRALALSPLVLVVAACTSFSSEPSSAPLDAGAEGSDAAAAPPAPVPEGCDAAADPKDAPKCVVSEFGVFVDATGGADANPGTKESPVKSITAALGKLTNIVTSG